MFDRFFDLIASRWWTSLLFGLALLLIAALVVTTSLRLALMLGCVGLPFVALAVFLLIEMHSRFKNDVRSEPAPIIIESKCESAFTANPPPYRTADDAGLKTPAADSIEIHDEEAAPTPPANGADALFASLSQRFPDLQPVGPLPRLATLNGIGVALYGDRDHDVETGTYVKTKVYVFFAIPIAAITAYRVANAPNGGWYFVGRHPLSPLARGWNYFSALCALVLVLAAYWR